MLKMSGIDGSFISYNTSYSWFHKIIRDTKASEFSFNIMKLCENVTCWMCSKKEIEMRVLVIVKYFIFTKTAQFNFSLRFSNSISVDAF